MHICIRVKRGWAEAHSQKNSLISQPVFLGSMAWKRARIFLGARTWCWVLSGCARVWSLWRKWFKSSWWLRSYVNSSTTVQSLQTHTHTNTRISMGHPILFKSSKYTWIGSTGLSNITAAPTATAVRQQVYIPAFLLLFSSQNVISHFHPGRNSRQLTKIISGLWLRSCIDNTVHLPCLSPFLAPPQLQPLLLHPRPPRPSSRTHLFPSLTSSSFLLLPACQDDFKLVASGPT